MGRHRHIEGKDYMAVNDIAGARPRYILRQEQLERHGITVDTDRLESRMHVKDINLMDNKKKFLYRREVNPLEPRYKLPSYSQAPSREIGPIEANRPKKHHENHHTDNLTNSTEGIKGA